MLTAICAIIPYVGALISCVVSVFLVLLVDPVLAVRCLIVYLAVQFIENQFIYPRVVGKSVGLSPLYTLGAAMIGGELFGIIGIIFFLPLTAVVIELVKEDACRRLRTKETPQSYKKGVLLRTSIRAKLPFCLSSFSYSPSGGFHVLQGQSAVFRICPSSI